MSTIPVLRGTDGIYRTFFDKVAKKYLNPPENLSAVSPHVEVRTFNTYNKLQSSLSGKFEITDKAKPESTSTVPELTFDDIKSIVHNPEEREVLMGEGAEAKPLPQLLKYIDTENVIVSRIEKEIMVKAKQILKTKSKKQQEVLYLQLEGFVAGVSFALPNFAGGFGDLFRDLVD